MEAMAKLKDGQKFNEVASAYSEDKARQGVCLCISSFVWLIYLWVLFDRF